MSQKRLNKIKYSEWIIWILLIAILSGLYYHSMILKNTCNQIIESILVMVCLTSIIFIRRLKTRLQINIGLIKAYGERIGFNSIVLINIGLGLIWIILGFLTLNDINGFIFKLTLGLGFIIAGLSNSHRYYIKITEKSVNKLDLDFIKIKAIELITFSSDKIILKTTKRTMEIFLADIKSEEKQLIINDFEEIKLKNNLA